MTGLDRSFGAVDGLHVLAAAQRLATKVSGYDARWQEPVHDGWIYRKAFPNYAALVLRELESFTAIAEHGGEPATAVARFAALDERLGLTWTCTLPQDTFALVVRRVKGSWYVGYDKPTFGEPEARAFFTNLCSRVDIPLRLSGEELWSVEHTLGLTVETTTLPQRLEWQLPDGTPEAALRFVTDFSELVHDVPAGFAWSAGLGGSVPPETMARLYGSVVDSDLPVAKATLNVGFSLAKLEDIVDLQAQCTQSKDVFVVQIARFPIEPPVVASISDEITKKGHRLKLIVYDPLNAFSKNAAKELFSWLLPLLDVKL